MLNKLDLTKFRQFYQFGKEVDFKDIRELLGTLETRQFERKQTLIGHGSTMTQVSYIRKGIVRCYHVNEAGEEVTFRLLAEHDIVVNVDSILWNRPSRFYYETLERTSILSIDYDVLQSIVSKYPSLEKNRKFVFQRMMREAHERMESFVLLTPEERYVQYAAKNKEIVNRVADKYIANVLGMTPTSLSRIRRRLAER
jgi:CRP-like cAMP-binding protein